MSSGMVLFLRGKHLFLGLANIYAPNFIVQQRVAFQGISLNTALVAHESVMLMSASPLESHCIRPWP